MIRSFVQFHDACADFERLVLLKKTRSFLPRAVETNPVVFVLCFVG